MRALHIPGAPTGQPPPYHFPDKPCPPEDLIFSTDYPEPDIPKSNLSPVYVIQVHATAVTKGELGWEELLEPNRFHPYGGTIPGRDFVGTVHEVHVGPSPNRPKYQKGDQVWGLVHEDREGAAADLTVVLEHELSVLPTKPAKITDDWMCSLATVPLSGLTAWQALFQYGKLSRERRESGQSPHVLITGAAGSVGVLTVQLAKLHGFLVVAVCSARHSSFLKDELGVDHIIDYTASDFTTIPDRLSALGLPSVDLVIDCVGKDTAKSILLEPTCVKSQGKIILLAQPLKSYGEEVAQQAEVRLQEAGVEQEFFIVKVDSEQLAELGHLISQGDLVPYLDSVFPLEQGREAVMKIEGKSAVGRGKVVISIGRSR